MSLKPFDENALAAQLDALSSATRLALLSRLREPRALSEIHVPSLDKDGAAVVARQTVRKHLDALLAAGFVATRDGRRGGRDVVEFVLDHQRLFALSEDLRSLARLRPATEPQGATQPIADAPASSRAPARALVLVKGLEEGTTYDVDPAGAGRTEWVIGRRRGLHVTLDFDPYLSAENSRLVWDGGAHLLETLPESRNGTRVNFRELPRGTRHRLRHGDLVGVGRSILSYRVD